MPCQNILHFIKHARNLESILTYPLLKVILVVSAPPGEKVLLCYCLISLTIPQA